MWIEKFQLESLEVEIFKNFHVRMVDDLKISIWRLEMWRSDVWTLESSRNWKLWMLQSVEFNEILLKTETAYDAIS